MPAGKLLDCSLQHFPLQGNQLGGNAGGTGWVGKSGGRKQEGNRIRAAAKAQQQAQAAAPRQQHTEPSLWCAPTPCSHLHSHAGQGRFVPSNCNTTTQVRLLSPSSHWFPLAMAVVGLIHMTVVPAAHCFYSTGTISARMCGSCLLCLVPASGSLQVPRTAGHLKEPRGLSGSEARDEEGTPFPAHQKASITFLALKITGRTGTGIQKAISAALASGKSHENPLDVNK